MRKLIVSSVWFLISLLIVGSNIATAEIYKWVVNGKVHYSDHPQIGARKVKKLTLPKLSTHSAVNVNPGRLTLLPETTLKKVAETYSVAITSPKAEQNFNGHAGNVTLRFRVSPKLKSGAGHVIQYRIDEQSSVDVKDLEVNLNNVDRGAHKLFVKIVDNQGIDLSSEVRAQFYVQRPSSLILQNLKNTNSAAPSLSKAKPVKGITAPPANPK